ncbi:hypothetical protein EOI86_02755 [Hwanghaeella grinnelliae]|uniref:Uncharacterized protein n=1 Tax=Hwanghaeella grinnelliae TaxID=2500179 RepID=A0A437QUR4_9PROT|nr:hypothetical protein EOI86_02755 [Hwanghaeella grinnelliae]
MTASAAGATGVSIAAPAFPALADFKFAAFADLDLAALAFGVLAFAVLAFAVLAFAVFAFTAADFLDVDTGGAVSAVGGKSLGPKASSLVSMSIIMS